MKRWVGRWLMGIAAIHTAFAVAVFGEVLASIAKRGVFNTVGADPMTAAVVWFVLFGAMLFVCGLAVAELEASSPPPFPGRLAGACWRWELLASPSCLPQASGSSFRRPLPCSSRNQERSSPPLKSEVNAER